LKSKISYTIIDYDSIQELIREGINDELINILSSIESTYPFTFFEKENLRKRIDVLDKFFWIKNRKGFCELVNQKLSEYFDLAALQLEGNHEELLFPETSRRILKSFSILISETKKAALVRGLNFITKKNFIYFDLISVPIIDAENTVIGIICISLNHSTKEVRVGSEINSKFGLNIDNIPFPAALLTKIGYIKHVNSKFLNLVGLEVHELTNSLINEVFSTNFIKLLEDFGNSPEQEIAITSSLFLRKKTNSQLFLLGKIFDEIDSVIVIICNTREESIKELLNPSENDHFMIENLIRYNPDAVLICDKENLKFLEVNEIATNLYGYRREEFLCLDLTDLYSAEDIQLLLDSSNASLREGSFQGPYKHRKKDGTVILVEISRITIRFGDREAYFHVVRNITVKLEHEKRNQSLKSVFDHSEDLIFITDYSGFISFINHSVTKILGFTKNELMNSSFATLVSDEDRSNLMHSIFSGNKKDESSIELTLKTIDGRFLMVSLVASPILDFNKELDSLTLIGKVKEEKTILESEELKTTIVDSKMKEMLTEKLDSKFLKDLFHELLTPINVILGLAQEITESVEQPTEAQKETTRIINQNRTILLNSMNTALEYSSISDEDLNLLLAETNITVVIEQLVKDIEKLKSPLDAEFLYGKISSSLKFETDRQKFRYFLLLLFRIVAIFSGHKKIYFSAYPKDKEYFLVTFRDLQTQSSRSLISSLKNIFENFSDKPEQELGISRILIKSAQKLLRLLNGVFTITDVGKDKNDYGFIFPMTFRKEEKKDISEADQEAESVSSQKKEVSGEVLEDKSAASKKSESPQPDDLSARLQNELRMETLRNNIRRKELHKKRKRIEEDKEEIFELSDHDDENAEDVVEFFDVDLHETSEPEVEAENIEIVETTSIKEKSVKPPLIKQTDEKVDISNFSCLYFEDQVDSQVLFSVQMKGLKNLHFVVSFEESLPLLDSGTYDFIVIDMNLQGSYNGLDILRILRSMPKYENTPVFAVTAYVLPGDQQKFVLAGFNGFLSKPIFRDQMIDLLADVFNESKKS
jgi:PAS domain S-box-containing protein